MKRSLAFLLILAASSTLAWESELAPFLEVRPDVERERRYVRFSCEIPSSDMEMPKEPLDVFGLSFGLCFDCVPGRMAGLQWGSLVAEAASATGLQGSFGLTSACESDGIQLGLLVAGSENHAGVQFGGLSADSERLTGLQFGGLEAMVGHLDGISVGLLHNSVRSGHGIAASLGTTWTTRYRNELFSGVQLAGIVNYSQDVCGVQIALGANHAHDCCGLQAALFYNRADKLHGVQIGFVNVAHSGSGVQIGFFNLLGSDDDLLMIPFLNARF